MRRRVGEIRSRGPIARSRWPGTDATRLEPADHSLLERLCSGKATILVKPRGSHRGEMGDEESMPFWYGERRIQGSHHEELALRAFLVGRIIIAGVPFLVVRLEHEGLRLCPVECRAEIEVVD